MKLIMFLLMIPCMVQAQKDTVQVTMMMTASVNGGGQLNSGAEAGVVFKHVSLTAGYRTYFSTFRGRLDMYQPVVCTIQYSQDLKRWRLSERGTAGTDGYREYAVAFGYRVDDIGHVQFMLSRNNHIEGLLWGGTWVLEVPFKHLFR